MSTIPPRPVGADAGAVVDVRLRLNGIVGLRVADASMMPRVVRGNTHAAVVMTARFSPLDSAAEAALSATFVVSRLFA
ncbi:GMC oxidoreductase [Mesorhizobium sp. BAC0120]|uniref:GMC oxidoreductase n=1 Tax=Mesorhizobium sp. BAC0120 TaxID=3090670 RepID=UPI00298BEE6E|nr:GMC oxidoreductase [Mesorhizobium sp. BAC0120]MDW6026022.1 GMC oxidoreductase [Mesorhizobium sp. BAC0120]